MAKNNPPDGFELVGTVGAITGWGTDADENTAVTNTIGSSSVELKNTTPAGLVTFRYKDLIPVQQGLPYKHTAVVQADSVAAGRTITTGIWWYTAAKTYASQSASWNAVLPAANTWYELSGTFEAPANARYARPFIIKANGVAFTTYLDFLTIDRMPVCFWAYRTAAQNVAVGFNKVQFDVESYDYGSIYDHSANYRFTAPADGVYGLYSRTALANMASGDQCLLTFYKNGVANIPGTNYRMQANTWTPSLIVSAPAVYLARGDYIEVYVWHDNAGGLQIPLTTHGTFFMGAKVE